MGEAKRRGTFEQRKAQAIVNKKKREKMVAAVRKAGKDRANEIFFGALKNIEEERKANEHS
jgi:hypothetical protein